MPDMLFILLLALVIFGPKKLPEMARQLGKYLAQIRRARSEIMNQIEGEIRKLDEAAPAAPQIRDSPHQRAYTPASSRSDEFREMLKVFSSGSNAGPSKPDQRHA